ncbi:MAG: fructose-1,6-bisphosphatase [Lachnospiraceae bacterium]|nr:fructose-1,6-bisphosphatase [Lachnospiraceae bacterium]
MDENEIRFLKLLREQYPTIASASTEIINLQSILNLPKATEHFMTDIHGEYEQFLHVLNNGSGSIRRKIDEEFGNTLSEKDKKSLATLIYYPEEKLDIIMSEEDNINDWYKITLHRLVQITKRVASKYTRSKVRKALPKDFAYVIEELITEKEEVQNKEAYYNEIIHTIIKIDRAPEFIVALCNLIRVLVIDHLHIIGDIFDRGPGPHIVMEELMAHHSLDIQWGNHDVVWMGAAAGSMPCIATVIRMAARYGNLDTIEDGYGINLIPLATFAMDVYKDTDCSQFALKSAKNYDPKDYNLEVRMHKAIAIIQFKLEGQLIMRNPEFGMDDRLLLDKIDYDNKSITINGKTYPMKDTDFPTIDRENPYALSKEEEIVMEKIRHAFKHSEILQGNIRFLYTKGSMYKIFNSNLMYHGCVPLDENGEFKKVTIYGQEYSGKALYDVLEHYARKGYYSRHAENKQKGEDILYYIWANANSPVFGKDKMATFEAYFIDDKDVRKEKKNKYYELLDDEKTVDRILEEFGLDPRYSHIINGHVPVEQKNGENPVKCGGKLMIIDGGFSKAYQGKTGIAGYTLVYSSHGMRIAAHSPFESKEEAIRNETDVYSDNILVETPNFRLRVADTDTGNTIRDSIAELEMLLQAYRDGTLSEKE